MVGMHCCLTASSANENTIDIVNCWHDVHCCLSQVAINGCNVETIEVKSTSVLGGEVAVVLEIKLATSRSREELRVLRVTYITITGWYLE